VCSGGRVMRCPRCDSVFTRRSREDWDQARRLKWHLVHAHDLDPGQAEAVAYAIARDKHPSLHQALEWAQ
jgi:hypothetical protein